MEKNMGKPFAWTIIIIFSVLIIFAIFSGISQWKEHNEVIKEIEPATTLDEIVKVHMRYADEYFGVDSIDKALDKVCYNYLNTHIKDVNGVCMPYYVSYQEKNIRSNYKMVIIYIKDLDNVYILPKDIISQAESDSEGNEKINFDTNFFDIVNNTFKIENIKNADDYRFKITGSTAHDGNYSNSTIKYVPNITFFMDSYQSEKKHLWLDIDKYNNISLMDINDNFFTDSPDSKNYASSNYYITTPNIFNFKDIAKQSNIEINSPSVLIKNNSVLYTYNIGIDEATANEFYHKYQEYLKNYYTITTKNDIVYAYTNTNDLVALIQCGHEENGYFMMMSFNYSDKYISTNNSSNSKYNYNSSGSSTKKSGGCGYKYSDGSTCGRAVGSHAPLCDYHFKELDSTYKSLTGGY